MQGAAAFLALRREKEMMHHHPWCRLMQGMPVQVFCSLVTNHSPSHWAA